MATISLVVRPDKYRYLGDEHRSDCRHAEFYEVEEDLGRHVAVVGGNELGSHLAIHGTNSRLDIRQTQRGPTGGLAFTF